MSTQALNPDGTRLIWKQPSVRRRLCAAMTVGSKSRNVTTVATSIAMVGGCATESYDSWWWWWIPLLLSPVSLPTVHDRAAATTTRTPPPLPARSPFMGDWDPVAWQPSHRRRYSNYYDSVPLLRLHAAMPPLPLSCRARCVSGREHLLPCKKGLHCHCSNLVSIVDVFLLRMLLVSPFLLIGTVAPSASVEMPNTRSCYLPDVGRCSRT